MSHSPFLTASSLFLVVLILAVLVEPVSGLGGGGTASVPMLLVRFYSDFSFSRHSLDAYLDILGIKPQTSHLLAEQAITEPLPTSKYTLCFIL